MSVAVTGDLYKVTLLPLICKRPSRSTSNSFTCFYYYFRLAHSRRHFKMLSSLFALVVAAAGFASADLIRCGTGNPNATHKAEMNEAVMSADMQRVVAQAVSVNTYVHIVTTSAKSGQYTRAMATEQMKVMNSAYAPLGISFTTAAIDITVNNAWAAASQGSTAEKQMKQNLRQGKQ